LNPATVDTPRKVLVRLPNWVGDVVMATPALRALRLGFPAAEIVLLGKPHLLPIVEGAPWFDRTIGLDAGGGRSRARGFLGKLLEPLRAGLRLRRERFDLAVLLPNSWSTAIAALAAGIPRRAGYDGDRRGLVLTDAVRVRRRGRLRPLPMVKYYLALCRKLGCPLERAGAHLELPRVPAAEERAEAYLRARGVAPGEPLLALSPGASFGSAKMWEPDPFAEVGAHFARRGFKVAIYGGPSDREAVADIAARIRTRLAGSGRGSGSGAEDGASPPIEAPDVPLSDLCAHMRRARALVSTDSGGRHFGVAAGIPVVVVMGSTHPAYTEVDSDRYCVLLEKVECWPCHLRTCPIDRRCMTRIPAARAIAAVEAFLAGRRPFGGARPWMDGVDVLDVDAGGVG
jgi:heptosyltransferase-2